MKFNTGASGSPAFGHRSVVKRFPGPTIFKILDIPNMNNTYLNTIGLNIVASGLSSNWVGCEVFEKDTIYSPTFTSAVYVGTCPIGTTESVLPSGRTNLFDRVSTVTVNSTGILYDSTEEFVLNNKNINLIIIGAEVLQYVNAQDNLDGTYTLSTFLRGMRGTEWAIGTHSIGEDFIKWSNNVFMRKGINTTKLYTGISFGNELDGSETYKQVTNTGVNIKPLNPVYFRSDRLNNADIKLDWLRRSRYISASFNTLPAEEGSESYDIEIYNSSDVLQTTKSGISTNTYTYTIADQATDGFASSDDIKFKVYQISSIVGKGYESEYIMEKGI